MNEILACCYFTFCCLFALVEILQFIFQYFVATVC
jgi:hypothetical protein